MRFKNVSIASVAHVDAPHVITSQWICEQVLPALNKIGASKDLLESLTGIKARRFWDRNMPTSRIAALAGEKAIQQAGLDRSKIGILINTSVCRDYLEPSTACFVHHLLGLGPDCLNFDLSNACLAFINGIEMAGNLIDSEQIDYGIVVDGENSRRTVERAIQLIQENPGEHSLRDYIASLTLGSGGGAVIVGRSDLVPEGHKVVGSVTMAATEHNLLCLGHLDWEMKTDPSGLLTAGVKLARDTWGKACREMGWHTDYFNQCIIHQVSRTHTNMFAKQLGLDMDRFYLTYPEFGNIGPAAVPITLSKALEAGRLKKGDRVSLLGIGSGINCTMMEVEW